jgi:hypothetical protein
MDREDSAIVHHRLESHSNVTFKPENKPSQINEKYAEGGGVGIFSGIEYT